MNKKIFVATELTDLEKYDFTSFVPCKDSNDGLFKKMPCKGAKNFYNNPITAEQLSTFPDMEMVAIVLTDEYLAIDCDGQSAIEKLNSLKLDLPETLTISSNPGERQALIYKIEKPFEHFSINTGDNEQLEFRTGKHYQVIIGKHPKTKKPYQTNGLPVATITADNLTNTFLQSKGKSETVSNDLPYLQYFLTGSDRLLICSGAGSGSRNNSGAKLARNLIGTENRLIELKIKFQESASELFEQYCEACDPALDSSEARTIWNSAEKSNPEPTLDNDELIELSKEWNSVYSLEQNLEKVQEKQTLGKFEQLTENVNKLKSANFDSKQLPIMANFVFEQTFKKSPGYKDSELIETIKKWLSEENLTDKEKSTFNQGVQDIEKAQKSKLDVSYILDGIDFSKVLLEYSKENNIPADFLMMSLLTAVSSVLPKSHFYNFNNTGSTIANLYTVFIGGATCGKSISVDPFKKALEKLANEANNQYILDLKLHGYALEDWKALSKQEKESRYLQESHQTALPPGCTTSHMRDHCCPEPIKKNPYIITDASMQAIAKLSGEHKEFGLLIAPDELTDLLNGIDTINGKKDGALSGMISIWNGGTTLRNRASLAPEESDWFRCSLLSTIQTERFYQKFDMHDPSGICSRFLYVPITEQILIPNRLIAKDEKILDFPGACSDLYKSIQAKILPTEKDKYTIRNTSQGHETWSAFRDQCLEKANKIIDTNQGFGQWLYRIPEQVARIAMTLHCLRVSQDIEQDLEYISNQTMLRAIAIGYWLIEKASIIFKQSLTNNLEHIDQEKLFIFTEFVKVCKKILTKTEKCVIEVKDFTTHSFCRKRQVLDEYAKKDAKYLRKPEILEMFQDVAKHGLAEFDYNSGTLAFS